MGFFNKDNKQEESNMNQAASTSIQPQVKKRLYLVDYENVSDAGLVGVDQLTGFDSVVIFYGSKVKTIAYESLISITSSNAAIEHLKAEKTAKNYLDFQLTTYLGYKLGKENYDEVFVISKDSGFYAVVDFWAIKGINIKRQIAIIEPVKGEPASTEEKPTRQKSTSSNAYNNSLQKAFENDKTSVIYKATRKIFEKEHK